MCMYCCRTPVSCSNSGYELRYMCNLLFWGWFVNKWLQTLKTGHNCVCKRPNFHLILWGHSLATVGLRHSNSSCRVGPAVQLLDFLTQCRRIQIQTLHHKDTCACVARSTHVWISVCVVRGEAVMRESLMLIWNQSISWGKNELGCWYCWTAASSACKLHCPWVCYCTCVCVHISSYQGWAIRQKKSIFTIWNLLMLPMSTVC